MRVKGSRLAAASLAATAILSAAACSGSGHPGARTPGKGGGPAVAITRSLSASVQVIDDSGSGASSDLARALLASAPVVVVARDDSAVSAADRSAHAPVLLASSVTPQLAAAVRALHPRTVLDAGLPAGALSRRLSGIEVTARPSALPAASPPRQTGVAVLTDSGSGNRSGNSGSAVDATAAAAGATVLPVNGGDPRTDPAAIRALARLRPQHVIAVGSEFGSSGQLQERVTEAETGRQLPGGGQVMFPGRRLVALYGHPGASSLGALGQQGLSASIARAQKMASEYRSLSDVPVVPAFEIIATVAEGAPGPDGTYSQPTPVSELRPWIRRAADHGMYVVLDLQPGRANLLDQAKQYQSLLKEPNVGLGLDAEWKLQPGQVPLQQIGHVDIGEVNSVVRWLATLTSQNHLPQKALILHQFRSSMITDESKLDTSHDDLAIVMHMDGQGSPDVKQASWNMVTSGAPHGVFFGWKNFFVKDTPMISPQATMKHTPAPVMISYQ